MHLGVVLSGLSEHIGKMPARSGRLTLPAVDYDGHLHSAPGSRLLGGLRVHLYVVGHGLALHQHPCLVAYAVVYSDERLPRAADYLHHLAFLPLALLLVALFGYRDLHYVAVKGVPRLGRLDEHILVLSFHYHENIALAGHLHPSLDLGIDFLAVLPELLRTFTHITLNLGKFTQILHIIPKFAALVRVICRQK